MAAAPLADLGAGLQLGNDVISAHAPSKSGSDGGLVLGCAVMTSSVSTHFLLTVSEAPPTRVQIFLKI